MWMRTEEEGRVVEKGKWNKGKGKGREVEKVAEKGDEGA